MGSLQRLYAFPTDFAREGLATLQVEFVGEQIEAVVRMLAPSRHRGGTTAVGAAYDDEYFKKVLAHEVGTLYPLALNHRKSTGWAFFDGPKWFSEGLQEYIGLNFSTDHARNITQARYFDAYRVDPERVTLDLGVRDAYRDGALLVGFLHDRYGTGAVDRILLSNKDTFWSAVEDVTGLTPQRLHAEFRTWALAVQIGVNP